MTKCLTCEHENPPGGRFCSDCGGKLVVPEPDRGDVVAVRSTVIKAGSVTMGAGLESHVEECPLCGKFNELKETFRCKECRRSYLCLEHRETGSRICEDCQREEAEAQARKEVEAKTRREAEEQALQARRAAEEQARRNEQVVAEINRLFAEAQKALKNREWDRTAALADQLAEKGPAGSGQSQEIRRQLRSFQDADWRAEEERQQEKEERDQKEVEQQGRQPESGRKKEVNLSLATIPLRIYKREIERQIDQGQIDVAITHCRHILKSFPKNLAPYRYLGKAYLESQRYGDAADIFLRVLSAAPDDFVSHVGMGIIREDEGNQEGAIWRVERAFEVQPYNAAIQSELRRLWPPRWIEAS